MKPLSLGPLESLAAPFQAGSSLMAGEPRLHHHSIAKRNQASVQVLERKTLLTLHLETHWMEVLMATG